MTTLAVDTEGIDGPENNAVTFHDGSILARLRATGLSAANALAANDARSAFSATGALFVLGQAGTNVDDFRATFVS